MKKFGLIAFAALYGASFLCSCGDKKDNGVVVGKTTVDTDLSVEKRLELVMKYDDVKEFSEGLALVSEDDKCGFVDKEGNIAIPFVYDNAWSFSDGLACVF